MQRVTKQEMAKRTASRVPMEMKRAGWENGNRKSDRSPCRVWSQRTPQGISRSLRREARSGSGRKWRSHRRGGRLRGGIEEDALLHVEFFADESWKEAIDLSLHGAHFIPLTEISRELAGHGPEPAQVDAAKSSGRARKKGIPVSQTRSGSSDIQRFYESEDNEEARLLSAKQSAGM